MLAFVNVIVFMFAFWKVYVNMFMNVIVSMLAFVTVFVMCPYSCS